MKKWLKWLIIVFSIIIGIIIVLFIKALYEAMTIR